MSRRPTASAADDDSKAFELDDANGVIDPDPTAGFPQWSRSLLLLLDYAIIEGLQRGLYPFVQHLKSAEAELTQAAAAQERKDRLAKRH